MGNSFAKSPNSSSEGANAADRTAAAAAAVLRGASSARTCRKTEAPITLSAAQHSCVRQADEVSQAARHALVTSRGRRGPKRTDASACGDSNGGKKREQRYIAAQHHDGVDRVPYGGNETRLRRNGVRLCFCGTEQRPAGMPFAVCAAQATAARKRPAMLLRLRRRTKSAAASPQTSDAPSCAPKSSQPAPRCSTSARLRC